ncbi:MAG: hypothetical protein U5K79_22380 [Cyclobacteriaceae bacterium]|nr:hypothetical protein [Cyclobacteriaceae bacterium]
MLAIIRIILPDFHMPAASLIIGSTTQEPKAMTFNTTSPSANPAKALQYTPRPIQNWKPMTKRSAKFFSKPLRKKALITKG